MNDFIKKKIKIKRDKVDKKIIIEYGLIQI